MRDIYCGQITKDFIGKKLSLCGWIHRRRDHGGIIFIDLRDYTGIVQLVFNPDQRNNFEIADHCRNEFVLRVVGEVSSRSSDTINKNMKTGEIEVCVEEIEVLSKSETPAFPLDDFQDVGEEARLKNRILDLRRPEVNERLISRSKITSFIRSFLEEDGFNEFETPILTKATPEGARDYVVPSRLNNGEFYALPQSPQLFKQMLMIGGLEKYYQIARCFRDEDLRADRQPEFTQIDIEASFVNEEAILDLTTRLVSDLFKEFANCSLQEFETLTYENAIRKFGCDKPDLRIPLFLEDIKSLVKDQEFKVFSDPANDENSRVVALRIPNGAKFTRAKIDEYTNFVAKLGAKGLAYIKINTLDDMQSPILKFIEGECTSAIVKQVNATEGDLIFFGAGTSDVVNLSMSSLIKKIAEDHNLYVKDWAPVWIVDFPMFERNSEGNLTSLHHPFTLPKSKIEDFINSPESSLAHAYDLVLNGYEIGGGSLRVNEINIQREIFNILGISEDEAEEKFGFFLRSLAIGAPPHGGIALGLDRIVMLLTNTSNIRDVIAFPKTQSAACILTDAPSNISNEQMLELGIKILDEDK
ncbi:aspartate--tRNA ligase [SAR86 cluster bacterium]|nr:aspartate--tRNA ligase [SAR86 cluster bacterium]|tara:strand:+ start:372 stop:2126 length:1755 start_codon:yes stop_codon:yes gene_type:complete